MPIGPDIFIDIIPDLMEFIGESDFNLEEMGLENVDLENLKKISDQGFGEALQNSDIPSEASTAISEINVDSLAIEFDENRGFNDFNSHNQQDSQFSIGSIIETEEAQGELFEEGKDHLPEMSGFDQTDFGSESAAAEAITQNVPTEYLEGVSGINFEDDLPEGALSYYDPSEKEIVVGSESTEESIEALRFSAAQHYLNYNPQIFSEFFNSIDIIDKDLGSKLSESDIPMTESELKDYITDYFSEYYDNSIMNKPVSKIPTNRYTFVLKALYSLI